MRLGRTAVSANRRPPQTAMSGSAAPGGQNGLCEAPRASKEGSKKSVFTGEEMASEPVLEKTVLRDFLRHLGKVGKGYGLMEIKTAAGKHDVLKLYPEAIRDACEAIERLQTSAS